MIAPPKPEACRRTMTPLIMGGREWGSVISTTSEAEATSTSDLELDVRTDEGLVNPFSWKVT